MSQNEMAKIPQSITDCWTKTTRNKYIQLGPNLTLTTASDDFQQTLEKMITEITWSDLYVKLKPIAPKDCIYNRGSLSSKKMRSLKKQPTQPADYWQTI